MLNPVNNRRRLGNTDLSISTVGLGSWAIGGGGWLLGMGAQDNASSIATIHHAVNLGINWIDTAPVYGLGQSERIIGQALKSIPANERPFVFTKCGVAWDDKDHYAPLMRILRPDTIRRELEASLTRLGLERIDLYQIHWPPETEEVPIEDSWGEMGRLIDEGKVRAIGVSNFNLNLLERCEAIRHIDSIQPPFSLIRRKIAAKLIPWCKIHNAGVIVYSPMQSGLLTDAYSFEKVRSLADDDGRRSSPDFQSPQLERNLALRNALRPVAKRYNVSVGSIAIAWTLAWKGVTAAIVGARSPSQVADWIKTSSLELTPDDLNEIAATIENTGAGEGPIKPPDI